MTPNFMSKAAKIIAEIQVRTCIDAAEAEVIKELLQAALNEWGVMLEEYYEEEYYNAIANHRSSAYDDGYDAGYSDGTTASSEAV